MNLINVPMMESLVASKMTKADKDSKKDKGKASDISIKDVIQKGLEHISSSLNLGKPASASSSGSSTPSTAASTGDEAAGGDAKSKTAQKVSSTLFGKFSNQEKQMS
jgi:hypothetical protein